MSQSADEGDVIQGLPHVPVLRHLTYREAHMFELGLYNGLILAVALYADRRGYAMHILTLGLRYIQDADQEETREDLVRGYVRDGWYFAVAVLVGLLLGVGSITLLGQAPVRLPGA